MSSLLEEINNKFTKVDVLHTDTLSTYIQGDILRVGKQEIPLSNKSRNTIEEYVGFGYKLKKKTPVTIRDSVINKVFENKFSDITFGFYNGDITKVLLGHKDPAPLENVFKIVDKVVPDGELSLFKSNGFDCEFTVTTPEIAASVGNNDITRGGIYTKAVSSSKKPSLSVIPVLHRMFCSNQMSQAQKDSALKISGSDFEDTLIDLEATINKYLEQTTESLDNWIKLDQIVPHSKIAYAKYLLSKAHIGKKISQEVLQDLAFEHKILSAYDIVNIITEKQHGKISDAQRSSLWRLGDLSLDPNEKFVCSQCEHEL